MSASRKKHMFLIGAGATCAITAVSLDQKGQSMKDKSCADIKGKLTAYINCTWINSMSQQFFCYKITLNQMLLACTSILWGWWRNHSWVLVRFLWLCPSLEGKCLTRDSDKWMILWSIYLQSHTFCVPFNIHLITIMHLVVISNIQQLTRILVTKQINIISIQIIMCDFI